MKNFLTAFLVFIVWSFFGLWLYSWLEPESRTSVAKTAITQTNPVELNGNGNEPIEEHKVSEENNNIPPVENNTALPKPPIEEHANSGLMAITGNGETVFQYAEGFSITKNIATVSIPPTVANFQQAVKTYLQEHPDKEVHIISLYAVTENNETPNLGTQRGKFVKRLLVNAGVPSEKIVVKSTIQDLQFKADLTFSNSISFAFRPLDQARIDAIIPELPDAIVVYPNFTGTKIYENENLKNLVLQTEAALKLNPDLSIEIIGHTDNIGSASENYQLGLKFARQVRYYLTSKSSIPKEKVMATSKGESESIDTNSSTRGRLANQRIEVVFY